MTISEFRSNPELISRMRSILEDDTLRLWLETLDAAENPSNFKVQSDVSPHYAHVMLGFQSGYGVFRHRFSLGATPLETPKPQGTQADQTYAEPATPPPDEPEQ